MSDNLKNSRCYLARPIQYRTKDFAEEMSKLTNFLRSMDIKVLDPEKINMLGVSELDDRKKLLKDRNFEELRRQMKIIVRKDLRCVDISDFTIAYLPKDIKTVGIIHEIIEADRQRKPVLIVCPEGIENIPYWIFGIIPLEFMFDSVEALMSYLKKINREKIVEDRWQFLTSQII